MTSKNNLDRLIGWQLVSITDTEITLTKDGEIIRAALIGDEGGCCGWYDVTTHLLIDDYELSRNPIVTKVERIEKDDGDGDLVCLVLLGEEKALAAVNTYASSGSGWCYGACVTIKCSTLDLEETLAEW
jgi:hypothetical protein